MFDIIIKIKALLIERRVPWVLKEQLNIWRNRYHYYKNRLYHTLNSTTNKRKTIIFYCGFHGKTGGVFAIANIANLLSISYNVEFYSYPKSTYNAILRNTVKIIGQQNSKADLYICDVKYDLNHRKELKKLGRKVIVSCHGLLDALHGLTQDHVKESLHLADKVHFVSDVQQDSFHLEESHFSVIPNITDKINKNNRTNNIGIVGNPDDPRKNIYEALNIAIKSNAEFIHVWGSSRIDYSRIDYKDPRIIAHPWENNKTKIYNSFDVLVFLSKMENFSMVLVEALSCGIPCLLSNIPGFKQFEKCLGVVLIDDASSEEDLVRILNNLLMDKDILKKEIIQFWEEHFSAKIIGKMWDNLILSLY